MTNSRPYHRHNSSLCVSANNESVLGCVGKTACRLSLHIYSNQGENAVADKSDYHRDAALCVRCNTVRNYEVYVTVLERSWGKNF